VAESVPSCRVALVRSSWYRHERDEEKAILTLMRKNKKRRRLRTLWCALTMLVTRRRWSCTKSIAFFRTQMPLKIVTFESLMKAEKTTCIRRSFHPHRSTQDARACTPEKGVLNRSRATLIMSEASHHNSTPGPSACHFRASMWSHPGSSPCSFSVCIEDEEDYFRGRIRHESHR